MVSFTELGPLYLMIAFSITLFFLYRLPKLIRQFEVASQAEAYGKSYAAQALYELGKPTPNFSPLVAIMRDDLRRAGGEKIHTCQILIAECDDLTRQGCADASTFERLYRSYLDAIKRIEVARK